MTLENISLPFISADLPSVGGRIKELPEHFVVEEIPLYEASGDGPHLYLTLKRKGMTTRQVLDELAARYGQPTSSIGYAGLKDKEAVTTQTFSLPVAISEEEVVAKSVDAPWEVLAMSRHRNKLKIGHLLGNRFTILLSSPEKGLNEALAICELIKTKGLPNYFGGQRFGKDGDNAEAGLKLLKNGRGGKGWKDKFLLSALQSFIFNHYLALRIREGLFEKILTGEVCKKYSTGGIFISESGEIETQRLQAGELGSTGPIWGAKMKMAESDAYELEIRALAELEFTPGMLASAGTGSRRLNRILLPDLKVAEEENALAFSFALPKGSYATSVMREFIKN